MLIGSSSGARTALLLAVRLPQTEPLLPCRSGAFAYAYVHAHSPDWHCIVSRTACLQHRHPEAVAGLVLAPPTGGGATSPVSIENLSSSY